MLLSKSQKEKMLKEIVEEMANSPELTSKEMEEYERSHTRFMKILEENSNATDDELDELLIISAFKSVL